VNTNNGITDDYGADCAWYENFGKNECGLHEFNSDFKAEEMCCICGGGSTGGSDGGQDEGGQDEGGDSNGPPPTCVNTDNGLLDIDGVGCEGGYDIYVDDNSSYPLPWCGDWDDDDFTAIVMCCWCGGGSTLSV